MSSDPVTPAPGGPETRLTDAQRINAMRIAAAKVLYRVGEWHHDWERQAFGDDAPYQDVGEALAELVRVAGVERDQEGYPTVHLDPLAASRGSARPPATPSATDAIIRKWAQHMAKLCEPEHEAGYGIYEGWLRAFLSAVRPPEGATREPDDELWAAYRAGYIDGVSNPKADVEGYEAWCALAEAGASAFVATNRIANNIARQKWNAERRADAGDAEPGEGARTPERIKDAWGEVEQLAIDAGVDGSAWMTAVAEFWRVARLAQ